MKNPSGFDNMARYLLVHGIASAKAGENQQAYKYLERYLEQDPPLKEQVDAMYYLSLVSPSETEQREWVEKILAIDPTDGRARRQLAILNGELTEEKIVDPDHLKKVTPQQIESNTLERYTCEKCGGRLIYAPDGHTLVCEQCEVDSRRNKSNRNIEEGNFLIAMMTGKGHSRSINTLISHCSGCGAEFIIPPQQLSWQCPYCESNFTVIQKEEREIISPEALIPFKITVDIAYQKMINWWKTKKEVGGGKFEASQGIYLPMWTFDIGGFVDWQLEINENRRWFLQSSSSAIFYDDVRIPATRKNPKLLNDLFDSYDFSDLIPFEQQYLVNWIAETYDVSAGDAAINARKFALDAEYQYLRDVNSHPIRNLNINTSRMTVEQYKLILVPVWSAILVLGAERFPVMVNGQTGVLFSTYQDEEKSNWFSKMLRWID
jgi:DNA-directed RNA polymerase subunit RPC12/RpoP